MDLFWPFFFFADRADLTGIAGHALIDLCLFYRLELGN